MCLDAAEGDAQRALPLAEAEPLNWARETALAIVLHALGQPDKAQDQVDILYGHAGDAASYQLGQIYAQWGDLEKALEWLEKAVSIGDPGLRALYKLENRWLQRAYRGCRRLFQQ